jgi:adenosylhomocysteine nucleosidase
VNAGNGTPGGNPDDVEPPLAGPDDSICAFEAFFMSFSQAAPPPGDILYVIADRQEYGPALAARLTPLFTGVGPVEAAVAVAVHLAMLETAGRLPKLMVSLGSAGSRRLRQLGVYQAASIAYRDMDASALGFELGETPFLGLPAVIVQPLRVPGIPAATLSTGANVVSGKDYDFIDAEMVDMESYAVLRACQRFGLPLIVLRGISDGTSELREVEDWSRYLHIVDERLAEAVGRLEAAFTAGTLQGV